MHIFHSCENIKNLYFHSSENTRFDIFTGEKPLDWNYFFLFSQLGLREATLYGISVSFLMETIPVNKKSESLRSLIKEMRLLQLENQNKS